MDWVTVAITGTALAAIVSAGLAGWTLRRSRELEQSVARIADAAERPSGVKWDMTALGTAQTELRNVGDAPALRVTVAADVSVYEPEAQRLIRGPEERDLRPNEALNFTNVRAWQGGDLRVRVHWFGVDGVAQTWRSPLPPAREP